MYRSLLLATAAVTVLPFALSAEDSAAPRVKVMERVTVIGTPDRREEIPGSASIVPKETLERFQYKDVGRALREVPGVTLQEEDGHGLRPNIGIRGGRSNRSADITLMEDGILTGPAPYAAPEAYYFPQMERMESLEVIKGAGAVRHGPRSTNGVLNMVTKAIPAEDTAEALMEAGSHGAFRTGVTTGMTRENVGVMLNAFHKQSDGFKEIDAVGGSTGFDVQDIMGKFRLNTDADAERYQEVELKLGYYDEISDETYLGLTQADFAASPTRRYAASQRDEMEAEAWQSALTHFIELSPSFDLTTTLYHNELDRSWYRLNGVNTGGVTRGIAAIFDNPTSNAAHLAALTGLNTTGSALINQDNARTYFAQGVQTTLGARSTVGATEHEMEFGLRLHRDEEDRFQRQDRYDLVNGVMTLRSRGVDGAAGNRVQSAEAWSGFVQDQISFGQWQVTPGLRFEHISLEREDFGSADPNRTGSARTFFSNDLNVWIPGVGVTYQLTDSVKLLGGAHKGFAPPGVPGNANEAAFTKEEESLNYELGARYARGPWSGELIGFVSDYDNLLGRDSFASGGTGTGDAFNGGEVTVRGIEAGAGYDAAALAGLPSGYRLPLSATYTLMQSEFENSFSSGFSEWGNVTAGDELPYMPRHQFFLSAGLETDSWGASLTGRYTSEQRSRAGSGPIPEALRIDPRWVLDAAGEAEISEGVRAFGVVQNLLDEDYLAALRPAGGRPGMPLTALAGVKVALW